MRDRKLRHSDLHQIVQKGGLKPPCPIRLQKINRIRLNFRKSGTD